MKLQRFIRVISLTEERLIWSRWRIVVGRRPPSDPDWSGPSLHALRFSTFTKLLSSSLSEGCAVGSSPFGGARGGLRSFQFALLSSSHTMIQASRYLQELQKASSR